MIKGSDYKIISEPVKKESQLDPIRNQHLQENIHNIPLKYFNIKTDAGYVLCCVPRPAPLLSGFELIKRCMLQKQKTEM